jgi:type III pantothenate kinase
VSVNGLLAFDIGNTNIHMGLWLDEHWALSWRARTVADKMPDEYAVLVRNFLSSADVGSRAIRGVVIGSVVPRLTSSFVELVQRYHGLDPVVITSKINTGVRIAIDQPEQAGADRIANAAGMWRLYGGGPSVAVDFGTATNFDVLSANGDYCGGAIAPGITVAHDALVSRAARLHKVDLEPPPYPIGTNTIHAMQSGIFWGYVGLIESLVKRTKRDMVERGLTNGQPEAAIKIIGTGGLAPLFKEHTDVIDLIAPELTLDGLRVIYDLNNHKK